MDHAGIPADPAFFAHEQDGAVILLNRVSKSRAASRAMARMPEMLPENRLADDQRERGKQGSQDWAHPFRKGKPRDDGRNGQEHARAGPLPGPAVHFGEIPMLISIWGLIHFPRCRRRDGRSDAYSQL